MIEGLSHITFIVGDLDRMAGFLREVFGAEEVYSSGSETFSLSREKFFLVGGVWVAVMEGDPLKEKTYNHVADLLMNPAKHGRRRDERDPKALTVPR